MKILVISDSHGNLANLKQVCGFATKMKMGAIIHCGDWDSEESVNTVLEFGIPLYSVAGNADINPKVPYVLSRKTKKFNETVLNVKLDKKSIAVVHNIRDFSEPSTEFDAVFYGHFHSQSMKEEGKTIFVNPGALERDVSFAVYDTNTNKVELIHE